MKPKAVVIAGYYGFDNAGDELVLRSLVQKLKAENPAVRITVLSQNPEQTRRRFGVETLDRWRFWTWGGAFLEADRFILGGGGLLQESTGPWNFAYYLLLAAVAKVFGCRTEAVALGIDPIRYPLNRWGARLTFHFLFDSVSVRDHDSEEALCAVGVNRPVACVPDLVLQLSLSAIGPMKENPARVLFALIPWKDHPEWVSDAAKMIDVVSERLRVTVDLVPFFPAQDKPFSDEVAALCRHTVRLREWEEPEELLQWIHDYSLVVGMRYHALALAALAGKPFVGWGFQNKVQTLCRDFNQPFWSFREGWDLEAVYRQIHDTSLRGALLMA